MTINTAAGATGATIPVTASSPEEVGAPKSRKGKWLWPSILGTVGGALLGAVLSTSGKKPQGAMLGGALGLIGGLVVGFFRSRSKEEAAAPVDQKMTSANPGDGLVDEFQGGTEAMATGAVATSGGMPAGPMPRPPDNQGGPADVDAKAEAANGTGATGQQAPVVEGAGSSPLPPGTTAQVPGVSTPPTEQTAGVSTPPPEQTAGGPTLPPGTAEQIVNKPIPPPDTGPRIEITAPPPPLIDGSGQDRDATV